MCNEFGRGGEVDTYVCFLAWWLQTLHDVANVISLDIQLYSSMRPPIFDKSEIQPKPKTIVNYDGKNWRAEEDVFMLWKMVREFVVTLFAYPFPFGWMHEKVLLAAYRSINLILTESWLSTEIFFVIRLVYDVYHFLVNRQFYGDDGSPNKFWAGEIVS